MNKNQNTVTRLMEFELACESEQIGMRKVTETQDLASDR